MLDKFIQGYNRPNKIIPYIRWKIKQSLTPVGHNFHKRVRSRGATIYEAKKQNTKTNNYDNIKNSEFDNIIDERFNDISLSEKQRRDFKTYLKIFYMAQKYNCDSILEIGAGYSTALWAEYAEQTDADVISIDANFKLLNNRLEGTSHLSKIDKNISLIEGFSIDSKDLVNFYSAPQPQLGGILVENFKSNLEKFGQANGCPIDRVETARKVAKKRNWAVQDVVVSNNDDIIIPKEILQMYTDGRTLQQYANEIEGGRKTGVLRRVIDNNQKFDLIWFDSGELSSVIEWQFLKQNVDRGGLAAFHDVFFPKSMKNFLISASLISDPEWEILLIDRSTVQGLVIAQKK